MLPPRMTPADWDDHHRQRDTGVSTYPCDDLPAFLDPAATCPVCAWRGALSLAEHDSVTVLDASGEIVSCVDADGRAETAADPQSWGAQ